MVQNTFQYLKLPSLPIVKVTKYEMYVRSKFYTYLISTQLTPFDFKDDARKVECFNFRCFFKLETELPL